MRARFVHVPKEVCRHVQSTRNEQMGCSFCVPCTCKVIEPRLTHVHAFHVTEPPQEGCRNPEHQQPAKCNRSPSGKVSFTIWLSRLLESPSAMLPSPVILSCPRSGMYFGRAHMARSRLTLFRPGCWSIDCARRAPHSAQTDFLHSRRTYPRAGMAACSPSKEVSGGCLRHVEVTRAGRQRVPASC
jgi:hypothetical protein